MSINCSNVCHICILVARLGDNFENALFTGLFFMRLKGGHHHQAQRESVAADNVLGEG